MTTHPQRDRFLEALPSHIKLLHQIQDQVRTDGSQARAAAIRLGRFLALEAQNLGFTEVVEAARKLEVLDTPEGREGVDAEIEALLAGLESALDPLISSEEGATCILVVEDEEVNRFLIERSLVAPGRTILMAETGAQARTILAKRAVDLIVLDLVLPDVDGRSLLMELRHGEGTREIPVLVLSAKGGGAARWECLAYGARLFLEKPVDPEELSTAVAGLLKGPAVETGVREESTDALLTQLTPRWEALQAFQEVQGGRKEGAFPFALAVLKVEPGVHHVDPGPATAHLLGDLAAALHLHLGPDDTLARWSVDQLAWLAPRRPAAELGGVLKELVGELNWEGDEVRWAVVEPTPHQDGMEACSQAIVQMRTAKAEIPSTSSQAAERRPAGPPRVLLVEDDPITAALVEHRMGRSGFQVTVETDGLSAMKRLKSDPPDLLILDIQLPGLDGFGVLKRLREDPTTRGVPTLMLTSMGSDRDVARAFELGANDYLVKPFSPNELLARAHRVVGSRSR
ncbi:MAG: response regulator [Gemmatimonadota bacterium]